MRTFRHWTPTYIKNRLASYCYDKMHPDRPWLTRSANEILDSYLRKSDVGLEFGSGRSTVWFARRIRRLTSVEHESRWATKVRHMLEVHCIDNVDYKLIPMDKSEGEGYGAAYVKIADAFGPNSLDFCLVDGMYRDLCAIEVIHKIRAGGILVIDNVNWYLPSSSRSPNSRSLDDGPKGKVWEEVKHALSDWRRIWTSSGVTDTGIFFKPCQ